MPFYQFTVPTGNATLRHRPEIAAAMTKVHSEVTGAPGAYVHCSFVEVPPGSVFVSGEAVDSPRMVGLIRQGRSAEVRSRPGVNVLENGQTLPEATEDPGAIF